MDTSSHDKWRPSCGQACLSLAIHGHLHMRGGQHGQAAMRGGHLHLSPSVTLVREETAIMVKHKLHLPMASKFLLHPPSHPVGGKHAATCKFGQACTESMLCGTNTSHNPQCYACIVDDMRGSILECCIRIKLFPPTLLSIQLSCL